MNAWKNKTPLPVMRGTQTTLKRNWELSGTFHLRMLAPDWFHKIQRKKLFQTVLWSSLLLYRSVLTCWQNQLFGLCCIIMQHPSETFPGCKKCERENLCLKFMAAESICVCFSGGFAHLVGTATHPIRPAIKLHHQSHHKLLLHSSASHSSSPFSWTLCNGPFPVFPDGNASLKILSFFPFVDPLSMVIRLL